MDVDHQIYHQTLSSTLTQLPPETLTEIFKFLLDPDIGFFALDKDCISASQVCHRWRTVSLKSPILWTRISLFHPQWLFTQLKRSEPRALEVELDSGCMPIEGPRKSKALKAFQWILRFRSHRIRCLILIDFSAEDLSFFLSRIPLCCFPNVQRFWLEAPSSHHDVDKFPILRMLRRARHLNLLRLPFSLGGRFPSNLNFANLRTLFLYPADDGTVPPSDEEWMNGLREMSCLEGLLIEGDQLPFLITTPATIPPVHLTRLQQLKLSGPPECIQMFLRPIRLPSTVDMNLEFEMDSSAWEDPDFTFILYILKEVLVKVRDVRVWQSFRIDPWEYETYTSFSAWVGISPTEWPDRNNSPSFAPTLRVAFNLPHNTARHTSFMSQVIFQIPALVKCTDVEHLELGESEFSHYPASDDNASLVESIYLAFCNMPSLGIISLESTNLIYPLLQAIKKPIEPIPGSSRIYTPSVGFPALGSLHFTVCHLPHDGQLPDLLGALLTRQEAGKLVPVATFCSCDLPKNPFQNRRPLAPDDYDPWKNADPDESAREIYVHDILLTTFYFYDCSFD